MSLRPVSSTHSSSPSGHEPDLAADKEFIVELKQQIIRCRDHLESISIADLRQSIVIIDQNISKLEKWNLGQKDASVTRGLEFARSEIESLSRAITTEEEYRINDIRWQIKICQDILLAGKKDNLSEKIRKIERDFSLAETPLSSQNSRLEREIQVARNSFKVLCLSLKFFNIRIETQKPVLQPGTICQFDKSFKSANGHAACSGTSGQALSLLFKRGATPIDAKLVDRIVRDGVRIYNQIDTDIRVNRSKVPGHSSLHVHPSEIEISRYWPDLEVRGKLHSGILGQVAGKRSSVTDSFRNHLEILSNEALIKGFPIGALIRCRGEIYAIAQLASDHLVFFDSHGSLEAAKTKKAYTMTFSAIDDAAQFLALRMPLLDNSAEQLNDSDDDSIDEGTAVYRDTSNAIIRDMGTIRDGDLLHSLVITQIKRNREAALQDHLDENTFDTLIIQPKKIYSSPDTSSSSSSSSAPVSSSSSAPASSSSSAPVSISSLTSSSTPDHPSTT